MAGQGFIDNAARSALPANEFTGFVMGEVVDTADPQQMGRVRVFCPGLGDQDSKSVESLPWALYIAPFGGVTTVGTRGASGKNVAGPTAYGFWGIPKIGAYVLVTCIEGDTNRRVYMGSIQGQFYPHTAPHGRFLYTGDNGAPDGPLSSNETPIQPSYDNFTEMFTKKVEGYEHLDDTTPAEEPRRNLEWRTRGADTQTSSVSPDMMNTEDANISSCKADDFNYSFTEENGDSKSGINQGYAVSLQEPSIKKDSNYGGFNYDSSVYSWTTPGLHSVAMDDRQQNCRVRVRSIGGNQIILDDTNERIYIGAASGGTWIELDESGNIDIYGKRNISVHAQEDINFTAGKSFRVKAKEGIHLISEEEVRIHAKTDMHTRAENNIKMHAKNELRMEADSNIQVQTHQSMYTKVDNETHLHSKSNIYHKTDAQYNITATEDVFISAGAQLQFMSGTATYVTSGSNMHLLASGNILETATEIHMNSGGNAAESASAAKEPKDAYIANEKHAFWTSRVPEHEPWARTMIKESEKAENVSADKDGSIFDPGNETKQASVPEVPVNINGHGNPGASDGVEYKYTDTNVGRKERGVDIPRGKYWHR